MVLPSCPCHLSIPRVSIFLTILIARFNIGVLENGKKVKGINIREIPSNDKTFAGFSPPVDMSISVGSGASHLVHLPILSDLVNEPFIFPIQNSNEAPLVFKFYLQSSSTRKDDLIGSAATLLRREADCFGSNRKAYSRNVKFQS